MSFRRFLLASLAPLSIAFGGTQEEPMQALASDCGEFAVSLYSTLNSTSSENLLFSPYSIFSCLGMVYVGAREATAEEMSSTLHLSLTQQATAPAAFSLSKALKARGEATGAYKLRMSNALWGDRDTFFLSDFRHLIAKNYNGNIESVNFQDKDKTLSVINSWVKNETEGKIPQLLEANDIGSSTRLLLTNTIFFQGTWRSPFDVKATSSAPFFSTPENSIPVKMLEQTNGFSYLETEQVQIAALPFQGTNENGSQIAYMIVLPQKGKELSEVENSLSSTQISQWINGLNKEQLHLRLPSYSMRTRFDLNKALQTLGMTSAFTDQANFSGIDGMNDLLLSKVIHEVFFSLDESGVVAAAATGASMNMKMTPSEKPPIEFLADHPFLFFLVDLQTKTVLFMGKFQTP